MKITAVSMNIDAEYMTTPMVGTTQCMSSRDVHANKKIPAGPRTEAYKPGTRRYSCLPRPLASVYGS